MRYLFFCLLFVLASCKKETCTKFLNYPVGVALDDCIERTCQEKKEVVIEGQTVCACLTGWSSQGLHPWAKPNLDSIQAAALVNAAAIENDSLRLEDLTIYTAFEIHLTKVCD